MRYVFVFLLFAILAVAPAAAKEIYRTTNADGEVVYTDNPPSDDAEPVELDPLTTVPATEGDSDAVDNGDEARSGSREKPANGLSGIHITYPENEKGIRHNGGNVPIRVALEPEGAALPRGHRIAIVFDGEVRARDTAREVVISPVERGPHTVRARVIDRAGGTRYESDAVKFYLLRAAVGNNNTGANNSGGN